MVTNYTIISLNSDIDQNIIIPQILSRNDLSLTSSCIKDYLSTKLEILAIPHTHRALSTTDNSLVQSLISHQFSLSRFLYIVNMGM